MVGTQTLNISPPIIVYDGVLTAQISVLAVENVASRACSFLVYCRVRGLAVLTVGWYQSMADGQDEDGGVHTPREKLPRFVKNAAVVVIASIAASSTDL